MSRILIHVALFATVLGSTFAQSGSSTADQPAAVQPGKTASTNQSSSKDDDTSDWNAFSTAVQKKGGPNGVAANAAADANSLADQARDFAARHPNSSHAIEARKLEAIYLIGAASSGDSSVRQRMESTVAALRHDTSVPGYIRATVAGSHDFSNIGAEAKSLADLNAAYEAVARGLMQEFPDQPQGYRSLLTMALSHDAATAAAMVDEVLHSKQAPAEVLSTATLLSNRFGLLGKPIGTVLNGYSLSSAKNGDWPKATAGLLYFWSSDNEDSLALGATIAGRKLSGVNVVGVCLDAEPATGQATARARSLPGSQIYLAGGSAGEAAARLGVSACPLVYIIDSSGKISDVLALQDLAARFASLGM
jgi:hypothetical protein